MAKMNVTRKWVCNSFTNIISVPYCALQDLLKYESPSWFTSGIYGWNVDVYMIDFDTCIVTGYRPFGNIRPSYALTDVFNRTAQKADTPRKMQRPIKYVCKRGVIKCLTQKTIMTLPRTLAAP